MIDWLARAETVFSQKRPDPTDETDETPLLSVLSVPLAPVCRKHVPLSSVSSVGVARISQKRHLTLVINRCCDARGDDATNRQALIEECAELPPAGQADLIDHFAAEAIRYRRANGTDETDERYDV